MGCPSVVAALREGNVVTVRPEFDDLLVDGIRIHFSPAQPIDHECAKDLNPKPVSGQDGPRDPNAPVQMGPAFGKP